MAQQHPSAPDPPAMILFYWLGINPIRQTDSWTAHILCVSANTHECLVSRESSIMSGFSSQPHQPGKISINQGRTDGWSCRRPLASYHVFLNRETAGGGADWTTVRVSFQTLVARVVEKYLLWLSNLFIMTEDVMCRPRSCVFPKKSEVQSHGWRRLGSLDTLSGSPTRLRQVRSFSHFLPEDGSVDTPGLDLGMAAVRLLEQRRDIATRNRRPVSISLDGVTARWGAPVRISKRHYCKEKIAKWNSVEFD